MAYHFAMETNSVIGDALCSVDTLSMDINCNDNFKTQVIGAPSLMPFLRRAERKVNAIVPRSKTLDESYGGQGEGEFLKIFFFL